MKIKICLGICFIFAVIGVITGWKIGEQKGIAALPPHAWAGDGIGILAASLDGAFQGAGLGLLLGMVGCFLWWLSTRRKKVFVIVTPNDDSVWPPPPTQTPNHEA